MKVLLSAYACAPNWGSEPEVGWQTLLAAMREHDVWILTQPQFQPLIEEGLQGHPRRDRVRIVAFGPDYPGDAKGLAGHARIQLSHDRWQRQAAVVASELHAEHRFDVAHHVTLAAYWMRVGIGDLDCPIVFGPVGGAVVTPWRLLPELGARGLSEELVRWAARLCVGSLPAIRKSRARAALLLAQNADTSRRLPGAKLLSHSLCVTVAPQEVEDRLPVIVHAARLLPWKGTSLAIRAMRHVRSDVTLQIFGSGPALARLQRAVARWGVEDRVRFMGQVPRNELLRTIARSSLVLHPSLHEEGSIFLAESLSLGTPAVCIDHGGPPVVLSYWANVPNRAVPHSWPGTTARALAAAVDDILAVPAPPGPRAPSVDYAESVLASYCSVARA